MFVKELLPWDKHHTSRLSMIYFPGSNITPPDRRLSMIYYPGSKITPPDQRLSMIYYPGSNITSQSMFVKDLLPWDKHHTSQSKVVNDLLPWVTSHRKNNGYWWFTPLGQTSLHVNGYRWSTLTTCHASHLEITLGPLKIAISWDFLFNIRHW